MSRVAGDGFGPAGLALRMAIRSPLKLYAFALLLAVIALLLSGVTQFRRVVGEAASRGANRLGADLMVVPAAAGIRDGAALIGGAPVRHNLADGVEGMVAAVAGVRRVAPQYFLSSAQASCCETGNLLLVGFDPARDFTVLPWLRSSGARDLGDQGVLVGGGVMKAAGAGLRLYKRTFRVEERLDRSGLVYFDNAVFIPLAGVAAMERSSRGGGGIPLALSWGRPSLLLLQLSPDAEPRQVAAAIEGRSPEVRVLAIDDLTRVKRSTMGKIAALGPSLMALAWLLALAAGGGIQFLYWRERRPTLGLLRAFGHGRGAIMVLFGLETFVISLGAMVAGSLAALLLLRLFATPVTLLLGLTPLPGGGGVPAELLVSWLLFAGAMAVETVTILLFLLRREPAELMRGARCA